MESETLIGVICDHRSALLEGEIKASGHPTFSVPPSQLIPEEVPRVHVWVLDCNDDSPVADAIELNHRSIICWAVPLPTALPWDHSKDARCLHCRPYLIVKQTFRL